MKKDEADSIVYAFLERLAKKYGRRELLPEDTVHQLSLKVSGTIDDHQLWSQTIAGKLTIGHESVQCSSSAPDINQVIGLILARLSKRVREHILRTLPEEFSRNGNQLPDCDPLLRDAGKSMLIRLRAKREQSVVGKISVVQPEVS